MGKHASGDFYTCDSDRVVLVYEDTPKPIDGLKEVEAFILKHMSSFTTEAIQDAMILDRKSVV